MKAVVIVFCAMAAGCSYTPVADLRASGDKAQVYQRDVAECKQLAKDVTPSWTLMWNRVVDKCLAGRGHSVLNVR
jgi:hypothetical protein